MLMCYTYINNHIINKITRGKCEPENFLPEISKGVLLFMDNKVTNKRIFKKYILECCNSFFMY